MFKAAHKNWNLPLISTNLEPKTCSLTGLSIVREAKQNTENQEAQEPEGVEYLPPNVMEKFNHRRKGNVYLPNIVAKEFNREMSLREFCDKFNSKLVKKHGEEHSTLYLSRRTITKSNKNIYAPIVLTPFLNQKKASLKSPKFWFYCNILCLWCIPCDDLHSLLPWEEMSEKELHEHWINKYYEKIATNLNVLPKWAKVFHKKYHEKQNDISSSSELESDSGVEASDQEDNENNNDDNENNNDDNKSIASNESLEEDMDPELRATVAYDIYYQKPEDQMMCRQVLEGPTDQMGQVPGLLEMSNPQGEDFQSWTNGKTLPSYGEIMHRLSLLKSTPALPDNRPIVQHNHKQRLAKDIVHEYSKKWYAAKYENQEWPKALSLILTGDPGAGKSTATDAMTRTLREILGEDWEKLLNKLHQRDVLHSKCPFM